MCFARLLGSAWGSVAAMVAARCYHTSTRWPCVETSARGVPANGPPNVTARLPSYVAPSPGLVRSAARRVPCAARPGTRRSTQTARCTAEALASGSEGMPHLRAVAATDHCALLRSPHALTARARVLRVAGRPRSGRRSRSPTKPRTNGCACAPDGAEHG